LIVSDDYEIKSEFLENYKYASDYWAPLIQDAQVYTLAAAGYTWSDKERTKFKQENREPIEFNITRRPLSFFSGYLRDNINQVIYSPVEGSDDKTADQLTKLSYHVWDKGCGYDKFLGSCDEALKSGIALCGVQMDYSKDFVNGDIGFFTRTYNSFYLDPTFEDIGLRDCSFAITRDLVDKEYAKQLLPFVDQEQLDEIVYSYSDNKFMAYHPNFTSLTRRRGLIAYDQYYKMKSKSVKYLIDLDTGFYRELTDLPKDDMERLKMGIGRFESMRNDPDFTENMHDIPNLEIRDVERPHVELNIMLNGELAYSGIDRTGVTERYPFVPILCYFEPSIWQPSLRIQGISASNWSAQRQFNKRHMKILDMMDTVISTGFKYLIGSVPDPSDMQQSGQNRLIGVSPDAPQGLDSVQELKGSGGDPALMEYQKILNELTLELSNINESTLGADEGGNTQVSGRLAQVRIAQGLMGNRKIFDNIEISQKHLGTIILEVIQNKYPAGKVERLIAEEPTPQFYDEEFEQYDSVVKQGIRSQSQRDAYYYELLTLKRDQIVDVPESEIIKALSMSGISDLKESIEEREKQAQEQQEKVNAQEVAALELVNSQKIANLSLSKEREARVLADIGLAQERSSEASSNLADATLARAKTMVEIDSLKEERLIKLYAFMEQLHAEEKAAEQEEEEKSAEKANNIRVSNDIKGEETPLNKQQEVAQAPSLQLPEV